MRVCTMYIYYILVITVITLHLESDLTCLKILESEISTVIFVKPDGINWLCVSVIVQLVPGCQWYGGYHHKHGGDHLSVTELLSCCCQCLDSALMSGCEASAQVKLRREAWGVTRPWAETEPETAQPRSILQNKTCNLKYEIKKLSLHNNNK